MEEPIQINERIFIPGHELTFKASRSSGPGGQHVNKTNSRITLTWNINTTVALTEEERALVLTRLRGRITNEGELQISVEDERSQRRNREIARDRLRSQLVEALKQPKKRVPRGVPKKARRRRLKAKAERSKIKQQRRPPRHDD